MDRLYVNIKKETVVLEVSWAANIKAFIAANAHAFERPYIHLCY